jgi:hypothetical protein
MIINHGRMSFLSRNGVNAAVSGPQDWTYGVDKGISCGLGYEHQSVILVAAFFIADIDKMLRRAASPNHPCKCVAIRNDARLSNRGNVADTRGPTDQTKASNIGRSLRVRGFDVNKSSQNMRPKKPKSPR